MEKFAVDLDRVLDEFELNEDLESVSSKEHRLQHRLDTLPPLYAGDLYPQHNHHGAILLPSLIPSSAILEQQQFDCDAYQPDATLDLSDADFAPAPRRPPATGTSVITQPVDRITEAINSTSVESLAGVASASTPSDGSATPSPPISGVGATSGFGMASDFSATSGVASDFGVTSGLSNLQSDSEVTTTTTTTTLIGNLYDSGTNLGRDRLVKPSSSTSTVENGEVIDGIRVLHYDETINRDYLVTFGRRHDVPAVPMPPPVGGDDGGGAAGDGNAVDDDEGIGMADDESRAEDTPNVAAAAGASGKIGDVWTSDLDRLATSRHVDREASLDSRSLVVETNEAVDTIDNADEEMFVTPDDGVASVPGPEQFQTAPVGFGNVDVDVSDEDLRRYLEESCLADDEDEVIVVAVTPDGGISDRSPMGREEFFTPPLDKPACREAMSPASTSAALQQHAAEVSTFCREPEVAVRGVSFSNSPQSQSTDGIAHPAPASSADRRYSDDFRADLEVVSRPEATVPPDAGDLSRSPTASQMEQANRELRCQMLLAATTTTTTADGARVTEAEVHDDAQVLVETLSASPADEGWEDDGDLQPYPSSELRANDGRDECGDDTDDDQRRARPTSLHLPSKIDVEQPPAPPAAATMMTTTTDDTSVPTPSEQDEHLPFATLVATAAVSSVFRTMNLTKYVEKKHKRLDLKDLQQCWESVAGSPDAVAISDDCETPVGASSSSANITEEDRLLGKFAPLWVPDAEAPNCMYCSMKFTVIKRRHHCRACGKVLCSQCCGTKAKLLYMENKEARVCLACVEIMQKVQEVEHEWGLREDGEGNGDPLGAPSEDGGAAAAALPLSPVGAAVRGPNPNNPSEYCSVIPPMQQARAAANARPPTVMVPVGVLKRGGDGRPKGEPKQVMFSDGIRPGGDLTELDGAEPRLPYRRQGRLQKRVEKTTGQVSQPPRTCLPTVDQREYTLEDNLEMEHIITVLKDEAEEPLVFSVANNLKVLLKIVNLDCCVQKVCWCFVTRGLCAVGQDEIIILLELVPDEKVLPYGVFHHIIDVYEDASKGHSVSGMGHSVLTRSFLGSKDHGGFLYIRPTFQCLQKIPLPPSPYLFGILLQKWEIPWAKVFPLRLLLRLGAEFRYYPCPLVGVRNRKPVFGEIGHTIVNLLADFRNYQYSLPAIPGLLIHLDDKNTYITIPRNRYDEVVKALNIGIDHVMSLAASFCSKADSHLVCIQNEDGNYQTQAINIKGKLRKESCISRQDILAVTGASFVVFNGALKTSSGLTAKSCIVEDGMMVQISSESMVALRQALRDMKDYTVECGPIGAAQPEEVVHLQWVDDDRNVNIGVKSPLDGMDMDGVSSIRINCGTDYVGDGFLIRWTEVYLVRTDEGLGGRRSEPVDVTKVSDTLAQACCVALAPHLENLCAEGLTKIGLRVTLDAENVGYEIGACGAPLPSVYMNDLDSELVPAMHSAASPTQEGSIMLELVFHVLQQ